MARVLTGLALLVGACAPVVEAPVGPSLPAGLAASERPPVAAIVGTLGTAHRMVLQAAAPTGHWVIVCQARADSDGDGEIEAFLGHHGNTEGDAMVPYLIREAGPGEAIDEYAGSDRSGRHLAIVRAHQLVLLDTWYDDEVVLVDAQVSDDPDPFRRRLAVSFDDAGERVAYARRSVIGHEIVVHELASGVERVIDIGGAMLWRFHLDAGGDFVFAQTIDRDTDGDGDLTLPAARTSLGDRRCRGTVMSYGHYGQSGDEPVQRAGPAHDGALAAPMAALGVLHGELVVRRADGAIVARTPAGERVLVPAACGGRLVHVEPATSSIYAACTAGTTPDSAEWDRDAPLRRFTPAGEQDLGLTVRLEQPDRWTASDSLIYTNEGEVVHPRTGAVGRRRGGLLKLLDDRALFSGPGGMLHIGDLDGADARPLLAPVNQIGPAVDQGSMFAVMSDNHRAVVVDVARERVLGFVDGPPLAITDTGEVLLAAGVPTDPFSLTPGPLHWETPR